MGMAQSFLPNEGRAWVLGDRIDTDALAPGALMKLAPEALAQHCLAAVRPDFAGAVRPGDVVIGGLSFGIGSSREQAAQSLRVLGVQAVIAKSFARIFYRNAFNLGLPALILPEADSFVDGDRVRIDLAEGLVENLTQARRFTVSAIPPPMAKIIAAGGLLPYLEQRGLGDDRGGEHDGQS
jgi:3-isopropylmalate/(R)-2-methylmalate dehydratase small subunit